MTIGAFGAVGAFGTVGILGGGQLARMLALAGIPLGIRFRVLDPSPEAPAGAVAEHLAADFSDENALRRFASGLSAVTYEWENFPVASAGTLGGLIPDFFPPPEALGLAQDRLLQKRRLQELGIDTAPFRAVGSAEELGRALLELGLPAILKSRTLGYDGKGQAIIRAAHEAERAFAAIGGGPAASAILEGFVPFEREAAIIAVQGRDGSRVFYPISSNVHRDGILRTTVVPAQVPLQEGMQARAERLASKVLDGLVPGSRYVGALTLELFVHEGRLLVNEVATRVHNSGHWTIEGAETSQFENHLRALLGLPLGSSTARGACAMVNLIGELRGLREAFAVPGARVHLYGKQPRPGRKLGHVTVVAPDFRELSGRLRAVCAAVGESYPGSSEPVAKPA